MNSFCYILFSKQLNKFYIGSTKFAVSERVEQHLTKFFDNSFTSHADDWEVFFEIQCSAYSQALKIEKHLKRMKSRAYLENVRKYPEMVEKLLEKYRETPNE